MNRQSSPLFAAFLAAATSGPLFGLSLGATMLYMTIPQPVTISPEALVTNVLLAIPSIILIPFFLGVVPITLIVLVMEAIAQKSEAARMPLVWAAAGGLFGAAFDASFEPFSETQEAGFALVATSVICALIAWGYTARHLARPDQA